MKIYNYDRTTGEYLSIGEAKPDPLDAGSWLIPAFSTTIEPPTAVVHEVAVFTGSFWEIMQDYRTADAWLIETAEAVVITEIGPVPEGVTLADPTGLANPIWVGGRWVNDDTAELADAKESKRTEIKLAYQEAEANSTITVGESTYHSDLIHLNNIDLERRLAEANSETEMVVFDVDLNPHTVSLTAVDSVMQDIRVNTKANYAKGKDLTLQVNQATTVAEVEAINW